MQLDCNLSWSSQDIKKPKVTIIKLLKDNNNTLQWLKNPMGAHLHFTHKSILKKRRPF